MGGPGLFDCRIFTTRGKVSFRKKADFSTFRMSNMLLKCIVLIIKRIHSGSLLDCPLFATKPPFHPGPADALFQSACILGTFQSMPCWTSQKSHATGESAPESREFAALSWGGWRRKVRREVPVEPIPLQATGESEPFSRKKPGTFHGGWLRA